MNPASDASVTTTTAARAIDPLAAGARLAARSLATALALAAGGCVPTAALAGAGGAAAMVLGLAIALAGAWAGCAAPVALIHREPRIAAYATLGGLGVRFVVTLALAAAAKQAGFSPAKPMLIWVGLGQLAILAVDSAGLARLVGAARRPAEAA